MCRPRRSVLSCSRHKHLILCATFRSRASVHAWTNTDFHRLFRRTRGISYSLRGQPPNQSILSEGVQQSSASTTDSGRGLCEKGHARHEQSDPRQQVSSCHAMGRLSTAGILPQKPQQMCVQGKKRDPSRVAHKRPNPHGMTVRGKSTNLQTSQGVRRKIGTDTGGASCC